MNRRTVKRSARAAPAGLSRRSTLKFLALGGLLAAAAGESKPGWAQTTYLPSLQSPPDEPLTPPLPDEELTLAAIDWAWFRTHLVDEILPKWQRAITPQGLFLPHFDRRWQPLNRNFGTLVSQGRLLYNFTQGYALTRSPVYLDAVTRGAQYLLDHFRDRRYGGWYWSCRLDGTVRERRKDLYGHAFVIFGLAHAYQATRNTAFQQAMLQTWEAVDRHFRDGRGGFVGRMTETFEIAQTTRSQNPIMHLFEALLAAATVGGQPSLLQEARGVGDFVLARLVRKPDRRLPEVYNAQWQELAGDGTESGGRLDLGHAFEWAYLAAYAVEKGLPSWYMNYANQFLTYGIALGFDWSAGGVYSPATPAGLLMNQRKSWWEQCEAIRALTYHSLRHQRSDLRGPLQRCLDFVKGSLIDPQYGGWYPRVGPGIVPEQLEKGNEWKLDYHIVGMCMEAIRLSGQMG